MRAAWDSLPMSTVEVSYCTTCVRFYVCGLSQGDDDTSLGTNTLSMQYNPYSYH